MLPLRDKRSPERLAPTLVASSVRSSMSKSMWILVPALCAAPLASAEIFKCVAKNGADLYQNFPCEIDSLGSLPSSPPSTKTALPPDGASKTGPMAMPVAVASRAKTSNASEPRTGMAEDEVTAIWGAPDEIIQDEPRDGRIEIWRYGNGRSVKFSNKHRVLVVQR